ncbi:MAG: c-type cytochrome [Dehalococcoidia bacterium]|nr:c-type cytochrome [Dehalococcoidia bacterium]
MPHRRTLRLLLTLGAVSAAASLTLAACSGDSNATPTPISLGGGSQVAGFTPTPTSRPPAAQVTTKPTAKPGESSTTPQAQPPGGNPAAAGKAKLATLPCGACHTISGFPGFGGAVGPNLTTVGSVAATRKPGTDAAAYIRESIVNPAAFIAPNFPNAMPPGLLAEGKDLDNVVAYLLSLK